MEKYFQLKTFQWYSMPCKPLFLITFCFLKGWRRRGRGN